MTSIEEQISQQLLSNDLTLARNTAESLNLTLLINVKLLALCAMVYRRDEKFAKAAQFSFKAMFLQPDNLSLAIVYSNDLLKLKEIDAAEAVLNNIPAAHKSHPSVLLHKGKILYLKKEFSSAEKTFTTIIKKYPDYSPAHIELAYVLLMQGKWKSGWEQYEWRYRLAKTQQLLPNFKMPHWDGSENTEHLLLIADQGYGDCIQFLRYLPLVAQRCRRITMMRSQPLARLVDSNPLIPENYSKWEETPLTSAYCTLSGLPRLFSTNPSTIPSCSGIVSADAKDLLRWKKRINNSKSHTALRVGLAWSGRVEFEENNFRAVPFEKMEKLLGITGVQFFSLQVGTPASQAQNKNIVNLSTELTDFAETAAAMENLDLIITSDTSVAHLAGTLGRPTWILLNHAPDWRWSSEGSSSAWYPSARLIRQDQRRDWESVIDECGIMLQNILCSDEPLSALSKLMQQNKNESSNTHMMDV